MENIISCDNTSILSLPEEFYPKTGVLDHITFTQVQLSNDIQFADVILSNTSNNEDIDFTSNGKI